MKKLYFLLKNDDLEIINQECEYYSDENSLSFVYENLKLTIKKEGHLVTFVRESDTDSLKICDDNGDLKCTVKIKNPEIELNLKVDKFLYKFDQNKVIINYIIESDEGCQKTIVLSL